MTPALSLAAAAFSAGTLLCGCSSLTCDTASVPYRLSVHVEDAASGARLCGATVTAYGETLYGETLPASAGCSYPISETGPLDKALIEVSADGYQSQTIVYEPRNRTDSCGHPVEETVTITLEAN